MSASGRLSLFQRPLKRRLLGAYALMAAPQPYPQPYSSTKVAIATTVKTQKEEGGKDKGWPLSVKLVGIGIVAVATPSALKYAIENDWETRKAVEKWIPGGVALVESLRRRYKDGHFWDENLKRLESNAELSKLYADKKMLKMEIRCNSGKSSCVVVKATDGTATLEKLLGCPGEIENVLFLDDDDDEIVQGHEENQVQVSQDENDDLWSSSAEVNSQWQDTVSMSNNINWWDRCRNSQDQERYSLGSNKGLIPFSTATKVNEQSNEEVVDILERMMKEAQDLEKEKFIGTRSIDDIEEDIIAIKQQQSELRAKISPWYRKWF